MVRFRNGLMVGLSALVCASVYGCATGNDSPEDATLEATPTTGAVSVGDHRIAPWHTNPSMGSAERAKRIQARFAERLAKSPYGRIWGQVRDVTGKPIAGVHVSAAPMGAPEDVRTRFSSTTKTVTDAEGRYELPEVFIGPEVVSFEHSDYVFKQEIDVVGQGESHDLDIRVLPRNTPVHFDADQGTDIESGAARVHFTPGVLVFKDDGQPVHGDIEAIVTPIDPRVEGEIAGSPARLEGITTKGTGTTLTSYGMIEVELKQGDRQLQVRSGERVRVEFSVDGMPNVGDGQTIPMWHHEHSSGYWHQERDTHALVEKNAEGHFVATAMLPHFSSWNIDAITDSICTQFMLRRIVGSINYMPQSVKVKSNYGGFSWTMTPYKRDIDRGNPSGTCQPASSPACDRAKVYFFNAPKGSYGKAQQYFIEATNYLTSGTTTGRLKVRYPVVNAYKEQDTILASDIDAYLKSKANVSDVGNWCGPVPTSTDWGQWGAWGGVKYFTNLDLGTLVGASSAILPGNFSPGAVSGVPMSQYRMRYVFGLRPAGTTFMETDVNTAQSALGCGDPDDLDCDGKVDGQDNCFNRPNPLQYDSNNNGIGDACEDYCFVSPDIPDAAYYDSDGDGIDDWCDNNPYVPNDSQLSNIAYPM